jgi:hypothetical protein
MNVEVPGDIALAADRTRFLLASGGRLAKARTEAALLTGQGAWKFDIRKGFPYREIFDAIPDERMIDLLYAEYLASLEWISLVVSVTSTLDERHLSVTWEAESEAGRIEGTVTV